MFTEKQFPTSLSPFELDDYLNQGWYRMGQSIFTCHFLFFNNNLYSPIWTRLPLAGYAFRKSLRKILSRCDQKFRTEVRPAELTDEKERLFQKYRANFDGNLAPTLENGLNDDLDYNIFNTYEVAVYHGKKLVAFSFFDLGGQSIASIKGVFDPAYSSHSLGFFTMLCEMRFGMENGFKYYYPGYIVPGYPRFDYKLRIGEKEEVQFFDLKQQCWSSISDFEPSQSPVEVLTKKLFELGQRLEDFGIPCQVLFYPAYEAKVFGYADERFLESPLFLNCFTNIFPRPRFIVFYDIWKEKFVFTHCVPLDDLGFYFEYSIQFDNHGAKHFLDFILKKSQIVETDDVEEALQFVVGIAKLLKPAPRFQGLLK